MHFEAERWRHLAKRAKHPCVVLERGRVWNDYGYITRFSAFYSPDPGQEIPLGPVKILRRGALETELPSQFEGLTDDCCSVGQDLSFYEAVLALGPDLSREILRGLRDIVTAPDIYAAFRDEPGVRKSLLRSSEAEKAFRQAGPLFGLPALADQPLAFTFRRQLEGFESPHEVAFEFRAREGGLGRAMALVGKNGAGKTALLSRLAYALSGLDENDSAALQPARPLLSSIIAVSYSAFDTFTRPRRELGVSYFYCGLRSPAGRADPEWSISEFETAMKWIAKMERTSLWISMLTESGLVEESSRPPGLEDGVPPPAEWMQHLSSGHKIVLLILTNLLSQIRVNSMLLFDEPELHLHPQLLSSLMRILHRLLDEFDSYAVLATHSPIVLQEIPSWAIRIIEREGRHPFVARYPRESFGENLTEIVNTAFRIDEESKNYNRILKQLAGVLAPEAISSLFDGGLSLNARMALRALQEARKRDPAAFAEAGPSKKSGSS